MKLLPVNGKTAFSKLKREHCMDLPVVAELQSSGINMPTAIVAVAGAYSAAMRHAEAELRAGTCVATPFEIGVTTERGRDGAFGHV
jgi:hypothetical protein